MVSEVKDPVRVESGRRGAEKRWSNPDNRRNVRLDELQPSVRAAVVALIEADRAARTRMSAAEGQSPAALASEGHGNDRPTD